MRLDELEEQKCKRSAFGTSIQTAIRTDAAQTAAYFAKSCAVFAVSQSARGAACVPASGAEKSCPTQDDRSLESQCSRSEIEATRRASSLSPDGAKNRATQTGK